MNQTYDNIEIILVNDGSKDNSPEICKQFAAKDSRILFFSNENHGVSYTRNFGVANCSGDYIAFVGYLAALIIGGDTAALICEVIYKKIIPIIIYASTVLVLFGLVAMYIVGEKALTPSKPNKNKKAN